MAEAMCEKTEEEGLDMCDLRLRYQVFRSSTPQKERICSGDNMDCWNGGYNASNIADSIFSNGNFDYTFDEDSFIRAPGNGDPERDLNGTEDISYGGAWARAPDTTPVSPHTEEIRRRLDLEHRGVSFLDTTVFQVHNISNLSAHNAGREEITPEASKDDNKAQKVLDTLSHVKEKTRMLISEPECHPAHILERRVLHKKSISELKAEKESQSNPSDFRTECLRVYSNNIRGYFSKKESLSAIVARENIDVICLCETFMSASKFPELPGYISYFRNRSKKSAGGIALLIKQEKARYAVKLDVGEEDNEFLTVKFTNCQPHLVMIVYYGCQAREGVDKVKLHISQLLETAQKYMDQGCNINIVGDFNLHIGNSVVKNNDSESNPCGRLFMDQLEVKGLQVMNTMSPNPITFIDRSGKDHRRRVLDLVVSNQPVTISNFRTDDEDYNFTPYSVQMRKGKSSRTYADHMGIIYEVRTNWQDRVKFERDSIWNYKKQLGDLKYHLFTSNACNYLMNKVHSEPDINAVHKAFTNVLTKGKFQSYGKRTVTASKIRRVNDDLVWRERISEINKLQARFKDDKEINQIYKTRKVILKGQCDRQNVAVEVEETGEILEDLDDVLNHILEYNVKNMEKVAPSRQVEEIMRKKAEVIDMMLDDHQVDKFPKSIPWEVFIKVLTKVHAQKKACFRDIIKAGRNYKYALYTLLNRMYEKEEFPEASAVTYLTKIWKRKGRQSRLKDNRFVHSKEPISKLFEKCIVEIVAQAIDEATPQLQAGSRKGRSTRDQLLKVIVMQKYFECKSKPLPIVLVDVQACFDRMVLDDVVYDTIQAGADLKATRVIRKFSDKTEIRLRGDYRNHGQGVGKEIRGTLGQGSNFAPPGIGMTTSRSLLHEFEKPGNMMAKLGEVETLPQSYVDDMATMPANLKGVKEAGVRIGTALENISLRSHPDKSEIIVTGRTQRAAKMREQLTRDPALMQGSEVKVSSSGMYLGMKVSQEGHKDTVDMTARHRVAKAWGRIAELKSTINDAKMSSVGWLKAGVAMIRSVIIPMITYSGDVWLSINKATEKYVRDEYKSMVYVLLDIPTNTKWTSVLADLRVPNVMTVVDKLRINYLNHTLWGKGDTALKELLLEEHRVNGDKSLISLGDVICEQYKLPKVSEQELHKGLVKHRVKVKDEVDNWVSNITSSATNNVGLERTRISTTFFRLTKRQAQAIIAFNAGAFKLKTAWGDFHEVQACLAPLCDGEDELTHIQGCPHYTTRWEDRFKDDLKLLASYFVNLDRERRRRWRGECLF